MGYEKIPSTSALKIGFPLALIITTRGKVIQNRHGVRETYGFEPSGQASNPPLAALMVKVQAFKSNNTMGRH